MAILLVIFAFVALFIIDEPPEGIKKEPVVQKIKNLTKNQFYALKNNKNLLVGMFIVPFIGGPIIVLEIFILSWLRSFKVEDGPLQNDDEVYKLY